MKRVGIFGGTFSPPHVGHVEAARAFVSAMKLDELLIIPTFSPPHKVFNHEASTDERLEMCRLAFRSIDVATVSDIEIARGGKSYTYLTLEELKNDDAELYFLCGTDMFITLDKWRLPERIFELANICCVRRENDEDAENAIKTQAEIYKNQYNAKLHFITHDAVEISSSQLRDELARGVSSKLLLPEVLEYIESRGLYQ